jgi:hypothetical protein
MALMLANASQLKAEIRLAKAITEFEADLSITQKKEFDTTRFRLCNEPPQASDVLQLTAMIDRQAAGKGMYRCLGPRFANFLRPVQQYVALGDILVGGSQNIIACSVWTLVRMSVLVSL